MPGISVIVPTYQDGQAAVTTAQALHAQLGVADELLIVDNGSSLAHRQLCEDYARQPSQAGVRVLICDERGSYAARNLGAAQARGGILAFTDAGCVPSAGWLAAIRDHFDTRPEARVAGPIEMTYAHSPPTVIELVDARMHLNQDVYALQGWAATANMAMRRETFCAMGGFDRRLQSGGDYEFGIRAMAQGHGIGWCPAMVVQHLARGSVRELMHKRHRIQSGLAQIAGLPEFPGYRMRAERASRELRLQVTHRTYPSVRAPRWLLARIAGRLLREFEKLRVRHP